MEGAASRAGPVLLTTHYMAEADELCDRIAIVDRGQILASDTPAQLKRKVQRESIYLLDSTAWTPAPPRSHACPAW